LLEEPWNRFRPITYYIDSPELAREMQKSADAIWRRSSLPIDDPVIQRLLAEGGMLALEDLRTEESVHALAETFQTHSILLIALIRDGRPVGMMSLDDPGQTHAFSREQQQLARAIGQQASVAIDNARLYQQAHAQQQRAENLIERARAIYQVAMTVNSGEELPAVLQLATNHLVRGLGANDGMALLLEDGDTTLHPVGPAAHPLSDSFSPANLSLDYLPNFQRAISTGKPILISVKQAEEQEVAWLQQFDLKTILVVPLMGSSPQRGAHWDLSGKPKEALPIEGEETQLADLYCPGLIAIHYNRHRRPTRGEYAFAQDIAAQCALAIEKARLLTEAQQAANLANERANTLDAVFQAMTEGITVFTPDEQVLTQNHAAAHFLGVPLHSSASIETFLQQHPTYTLDGHLVSHENFLLTRALRGMTEVRGERLLMTRADGILRVIEITATPLRNTSKQQIGLVTAFRDITVQVQAEQSIHQALEAFLHIAEAVSYSTDIGEILHSVLTEALATLHCKRGMVYLFQQAHATFEPLLALGFSPAEEALWRQEQQAWLDPVEGQTDGFFTQIMQGHSILISKEHQPHAFAETVVLAAPIQHDQQILGLILLERSLASTTSTPPSVGFTNWDSAIVEGIAQLAGVAMDQARWQQEAIKARANAAAMREADTMKNEFLAITAHEFRNPLTVILARSQSAQRALRRAKTGATPTPASSVDDHLETIIGQTKQLNNIVTTFLDAARINQGQFSLKTASVDLGKIARQVIADQQNLVERHTLHCVMADEQQPYLVMGDQARLAQIIANLVENAIKYSPLGGSVTVSLRRYQNEQSPALIEVSVKDQGMGIPPDAQARLFERFYRVPHVVGSETRGVGLGLYIVANLVQMHGGEIHVESSGVPGEGSCFRFTLPELVVPTANTE
ncbi:MAG TPA: ATP-binding protein, partial [Ktedonobacteraceae bacterium]|nr:ATP-binding protein [Ktedonobacteraceae bacterium]